MRRAYDVLLRVISTFLLMDLVFAFTHGLISNRSQIPRSIKPQVSFCSHFRMIHRNVFQTQIRTTKGRLSDSGSYLGLSSSADTIQDNEWIDNVNESSILSASGRTPNPPLHSFWGQPKTKEQIRRHCAQTIFPNQPYIRSRQDIKVISNDLPLITIDNFLSKEMCHQIIEAAKNSSKTMKQSTMGVAQQISNSRTSSTLWLHEHECEKPLRHLAGNVSRLVGLEASHMENLQVVKYEEGQKFDVHTDHLDSFNDLDCRGRLATCLVYLNSSNHVDNSHGDNTHRGEFQGGCTHFPEYESYIVPKQGRAVFWFNTLEKPGGSDYSKDMFLNVDLRSRHSGEPVYRGEKWVCNRWVHPISLQNGVRDDVGS